MERGGSLCYSVVFADEVVRLFGTERSEVESSRLINDRKLRTVTVQRGLLL